MKATQTKKTHTTGRIKRETCFGTNNFSKAVNLVITRDVCHSLWFEITFPVSMGKYKQYAHTSYRYL